MTKTQHIALAMSTAWLLIGVNAVPAAPAAGTAKETGWLKEDKAKARQRAAASLQNLELVRPGLSKREVYALLDVPHFNGGFFATRWGYVLNIPTGKGAETRLCQMQILYDRAFRVSEIEWKDADCASLLPHKMASNR